MENTKITYKLNRFFNVILNSTMNRWFVVFNLVMFGRNIFSNKGLDVIDIITILCFNGIMILDMLFHSPKQLITNGEVIEFDNYANINPKDSIFIITKGRSFRIKVSYTVFDIKDIPLSASQ